MGRKIFQGSVIILAMMFVSSSATGSVAGFKLVKPEGFPNAVQLSSIRNRSLSYPPVERNLGTPKIEGSTFELGPEQNMTEEEAKNDPEATSAPIPGESVEIIEETQMNGVSAKLEYQSSDWPYFKRIIFLGCYLMIILCYCCSPNGNEENLESSDSSEV